MQAGESLSFITIPDELSAPEGISEIENEAAFDAFNALMQAIITERAEWITSIEQHEQSGMVTVFEGSFQVSFAEGSSIHLVAYGHKNEGGYLDLGLSLAEHSETGRYLGGYIYEMDAADIRVSRLDSDDD